MNTKIFSAFTLSLMLCCSVAFATPTSLFWTNCTTNVEDKGIYHIDVDNFFSVGNRKKNGSSLPPDFGLLTGLFAWEGLKGEAGIDYLGGVSHPVYFNTKVGLEESRLFKMSPSCSVGIFNVGTSKRTNQAVINAILGTTLPAGLGKFYAGIYRGKRALGKHRSGFMVGYEKALLTVQDDKGRDYVKWYFYADFASNKNAIGGGGFGFTYYINPHDFNSIRASLV